MNEVISTRMWTKKLHTMSFGMAGNMFCWDLPVGERTTLNIDVCIVNVNQAKDSIMYLKI